MHADVQIGIGGQSGSLIVDVKNFQNFDLDQNTHQLTFGAGKRLQDLTEGLSKTGRAMAYGNVGHIGVGGHFTLGGIGSTSRMWGTALDQLDEIELVLANGTIATASSTQNQDLFWAMRGAGQHFGIATQFKARTSVMPSSTISYRFIYKALTVPQIKEATKAWSVFISNPDLDRKFACDIIHSPVGMIILGTFFGTRDEFEKIDFSPLWPNFEREVNVFLDYVGYTLHKAQDAGLNLVAKVPAHFYAKTIAVDDFMSNATIDKFVDQVYKADHGGAIWAVLTDMEGGAINDPAVGDTAFAQRNAKFYVQAYTFGVTGVPAGAKRWANDLIGLVQSEMPEHAKGTYPGYIDPYMPDATKFYYGDNLPKLQQLKAQFDPKNTFWNPQSIGA